MVHKDGYGERNGESNDRHYECTLQDITENNRIDLFRRDAYAQGAYHPLPAVLNGLKGRKVLDAGYLESSIIGLAKFDFFFEFFRYCLADNPGVSWNG